MRGAPPQMERPARRPSEDRPDDRVAAVQPQNGGCLARDLQADVPVELVVRQLVACVHPILPRGGLELGHAAGFGRVRVFLQPGEFDPRRDEQTHVLERLVSPVRLDDPHAVHAADGRLLQRREVVEQSANLLLRALIVGQDILVLVVEGQVRALRPVQALHRVVQRLERVALDVPPRFRLAPDPLGLRDLVPCRQQIRGDLGLGHPGVRRSRGEGIENMVAIVRQQPHLDAFQGVRVFAGLVSERDDDRGLARPASRENRGNQERNQPCASASSLHDFAPWIPTVWCA